MPCFDGAINQEACFRLSFDAGTRSSSSRPMKRRNSDHQRRCNDHNTLDVSTYNRTPMFDRSPHHNATLLTRSTHSPHPNHRPTDSICLRETVVKRCCVIFSATLSPRVYDDDSDTTTAKGTTLRLVLREEANGS